MTGPIRYCGPNISCEFFLEYLYLTVNFRKLDSQDGSSIVVKKFTQPFASVSRVRLNTIFFDHDLTKFNFRPSISFARSIYCAPSEMKILFTSWVLTKLTTMASKHCSKQKPIFQWTCLIGHVFSYHITKYSGNALSEIINDGKYQFESAKNWIRELFRAVQYLHSHNV